MNVAIILHFITGGNNRIIGESKTGYLWRDKPVFYHKRLKTDLPKPRVPRFEREWAGWSNKGCNTKKVHRNTSFKPNKCKPSVVMKYIGRYLGRPVIATSRIDKYDGDMVTFHYNRHEDDTLITETIPALEFIQRLIRHIPEKNFKMIRYYGLYARHRKEDAKLRRAISKEKHKIFLSFNRWRNCISFSFGYDPIQCPCCKNTMVLLEIYYHHKRVPLAEMYEKVMSKHRPGHA